MFLNFEADYFGVVIATLNVIDGYRETLALWICSGYGRQQVGRERRDAALAWQVIADKSNLADLRILFHEPFLCSRSPYLFAFGEVARMRRLALNFLGGMRSMPLRQLSAILAVTTRPFFADFAGARFTQFYLYAHRVDRPQPGA